MINPILKSKIDGHSIFVDYDKLQGSIHAKIACSQCHSGVNQSKLRPCEGITAKVDCSSCHAEVGEEYKTVLTEYYMQRMIKMLHSVQIVMELIMY